MDCAAKLLQTPIFGALASPQSHSVPRFQAAITGQPQQRTARRKACPQTLDNVIAPPPAALGREQPLQEQSHAC
eukprot:3360126-Pyramimonas_sp.AAC.1